MRMGLPLSAWRDIDVPPASVTRFCVHSRDGRLSDLCEEAGVT
jgi:hypothetical protein